MNEKRLYLILVVLQSQSGGEPFKFMHAPITTSEEEAKRITINEAWRSRPEYTNSMPSDVWVYSFKRSAIEEAAREILGWKPPTE